jgi:ribonuclease BN (tRNA processing enzyme)
MIKLPGINLLSTATTCAAMLLLTGCASAANQCDETSGLSLQILGSGGPIADDGRASSAYVVWVDGKSKILVDAGGGAFLRFGEAGARFDDLEHIAISHFHTDHSADLVTLLKSGFFSARTRPLSISGPDAGGPFPALADYLESNIGKNGAYGYLSGYLDGSGGLVQLQQVMLDPDSRESMQVIGDEDSAIQIEATGVPHGIVPAIAYRVRVGDNVLVFASDQNGNDEEFIEFARDADVLVMHMVVPEDISGAGRRLHAPPSRIGQIAETSNARLLVLSHFMARSLQDFDTNVSIVQSRYNGEIVAAEDLLCVRVGE